MLDVEQGGHLAALEGAADHSAGCVHSLLHGHQSTGIGFRLGSDQESPWKE